MSITAAWPILFLIIVAAGYLLIIFNGFIRLQQQVDRAWSNVDVVLRQRLDEIANLVECVKGYTAYEQETLAALAAVRAQYIARPDVCTANTAGAAASQGISRLLALSESYPELKAHERFAALQSRITALEEVISDRREFYNHAVTSYNMRLGMLPDMVLARLLGLKKRTYFTNQPPGMS